MTSVLLIDSPLAVRRTLRERLSLEHDRSIVGKADDAAQAQALVQVQTLTPDCVLDDAETPDHDSLAAAEALLNLDPDLAPARGTGSAIRQKTQPRRSPVQSPEQLLNLDPASVGLIVVWTLSVYVLLLLALRVAGKRRWVR